MSNFDLKQRYNRNEFDNFIRTFLPDDYTRKETRVTPIGFQPQYATDITLIGVCKSLNLDVYEIHHSSVADARVGIANDTFKLLQHNSLNNNALVAFIPKEGDGQWRFSLLQIELDAVEQSSRIKRSYSNPRRYSYVLGPDAHVRTPEKYLIDTGKIRERRDGNKTLSPFEDLQSRFSVEVLSKEFYDNLFNWYLWATQHPSVSFPDKEDADAGKDKSVKVIRLITRMLFVWFIKQKGLVPSSLFDVNEMKNVLKNLEPESSTSSTYYNAILQNLFFATLNRPVVEVDEDGVEKVRKFAKNQNGEDTKNLYRYEDLFSIGKEEIVKLFAPIPFLNSSLFDCLDKSKKLNNVEKCFKYDGFSRNPRKQAHVPNELFFGKEQFVPLKVGGDVKEQHVHVQGLVRLFEQYNFTIEENSPREVEVSLDPELLGHVFENLLAAYNPETGESVRKSTGSFYTPREIVNYMVNESLVAYLKDKTQVSETDLRLLLSYDDDVPSLSNDQKQQLENAIKDCKVLDPACGSGAFPMGMLQQLVHMWERVFPATSTGYTSRKEAMYKRKLYLIEHCIFGVDIQPIAMLISKLRFFISLICEQSKADFDLKKRKENYGINTLPALETKFVAANTLIPAAVRDFDDDWSQDDNLVKLKNELLEIRHNNFISQSYSRNQRLIKKSQEKCLEICDYIMENSYKPNQQRIDMLEAQIAKLEAEKLEYAGERWIEEAVVGDLFGDAPKETKRYDANLKKRKEFDKAIETCRQDIENEQQKSKPQGFEKAVNELTAWDPYDQNTSSPFFDAEWMFGITDGFDVVIGNPPYISTKGVKEEDKKAYEKEFGFSDDTYNLFTFKGLSLSKSGGSLTYIIPKTFWTTQTKRNMRNLLLSKKIRYIYDTANPFESVMVDTCILQVVNAPYNPNHLIRFRDGSKDLHSPIVFEPVKQSMYINTQNAVIFKPTELNLKIWNLYGEKVKALYDQWWDKIKTSKDIEKNKAELERYRASLKPGDVALLGCLTEGGQGLATANNGKYIAIRKTSKWAENVYVSRPRKLAEAISKKSKIKEYIGNLTPQEFLGQSTEHQIADTFDKIKEVFGRDIFGQGYIYKLIDDEEIADVDALTEDEKANGIDPSKPYYVPYDKGDKDGNRWYLETPFAIAWSTENVHFLKTNSGKKGEGMPVVRNPQFYFKEGFCWTDINSTFLKARLKAKGVFDVVSMSLFTQTELPDWYYVCLINTDFMSLYVDNFINNTSHFQINDARQTPIVIPSESILKKLFGLFGEAQAIKKDLFAGKLHVCEADEQLLLIHRDLETAINLLYTI